MAAVYSAGDFRNGTTFEMEGNVYRVVEFQHVKPGKGSAFVRTKLKNVISTEPGFAGNTTTTSGKPATLETGLELQVPMFINIGDVLRIDTRTCEYMERI